MTENEKDIQLLQLDPDVLILKYQATIRLIVERYVQLGMFRQRDVNDIVQSVNEQLLQRIPTILRKYDGRALLVTYLSTVIRNICLHLHNESKMKYQPMGAADFEDSGAIRVFDRIALGEALAGFREVIKLYHDDRPRLTILLPLHFRIPLDEETIISAYPGAPRELARRMLESLGKDVALKEERELFSLAASFLNTIEGKTTSGDGYQHWLERRIPDIILLLRARLGLPGFNRESLRSLFEALAVHSESQK